MASALPVAHRARRETRVSFVRFIDISLGGWASYSSEREDSALFRRIGEGRRRGRSCELPGCRGATLLRETTACAGAPLRIEHHDLPVLRSRSWRSAISRCPRRFVFEDRDAAREPADFETPSVQETSVPSPELHVTSAPRACGGCCAIGARRAFASAAPGSEGSNRSSSLAPKLCATYWIAGVERERVEVVHVVRRLRRGAERKPALPAAGRFVEDRDHVVERTGDPEFSVAPQDLVQVANRKRRGELAERPHRAVEHEDAAAFVLGGIGGGDHAPAGGDEVARAVGRDAEIESSSAMQRLVRSRLGVDAQERWLVVTSSVRVTPSARRPPPRRSAAGR